MSTSRLWAFGASFLLLALTGRLTADEPADRSLQDARALAARIDQIIDSRLAKAGAAAAPLADDAEFLRRVYLDIAGRIPPVSEVREFVDDRSPGKRERLVEQLLDSPHYVNHFTSVWRALLLPQANTTFQAQALAPSFEAWLRQQVRDNVAYDVMVYDLLTTSVRQARMGGGEPSPAAFYQANELKPENLAAATSRLFLGIKLECAQCHDHPFAHWTRSQFWEYAAFFGGMEPQTRGIAEVDDQHEMTIPGTDKVVKARFLSGDLPKWDPNASTRATLADWVTARDNPYFARAAANRLWAHFFGIGLVEPVDDLGDENPPSHPELLDELGRQFADHEFDVRFLIRAITLSRAYQRSSAATVPGPDNARLFAQMAVRGLTPEQLFDSLVEATAFREPPAPNQQPFPVPSTPRAEFLAKFSTQDKRTETNTSILQALALMNGRISEEVTSLERSGTLAAVADAPFLSRSQRVEALYLATLGRKPRPEELDRLVKYVRIGGPKGDERAALGDVFWALLNSGEFMLNH
jgi:hypothetical protein